MAWNFNPMQHRSALGNPTMAGASGLINAEMSGVDRIAGGLDAYNQENAIAKKRAELEAKGFILDENGRVIQKPKIAGVAGLSRGGKKQQGKSLQGEATQEQQSLAESFAENKARVEELTKYLASGKGGNIDRTDASLLLEKLKVEQALMLPKITKGYKMQGKLSNIGASQNSKSQLATNKKRSFVGDSVKERALMRSLTPKQRKLVENGARVIGGVVYLPGGVKATDRNIDRYYKQKVKRMSESLVPDTGLPKHL